MENNILEESIMKVTKDEALVLLTKKLIEKRLHTVLDKCIQMKLNKPEPIKYNPDLDNNDYAEYLAKKEGKLSYI